MTVVHRRKQSRQRKGGVEIKSPEKHYSLLAKFLPSPLPLPATQTLEW
jgi:hypothetical protein